MKKCVLVLALACVGLMTVASVSHAAFMVTEASLLPAGQNWALEATSYGYQFKVGPNDLRLTALGSWDDGTWGNSYVNSQVALYLGAAASPLAQVTVAESGGYEPTVGDLRGFSVTSGNGKGQYRFLDLANPIILTHGETYRLASLNKRSPAPGASSNRDYYGGTTTFSSDVIDVLPGQFIDYTGIVPPPTQVVYNLNEVNGQAMVMHANMQYEVVPEPITLGLLLGGLTMLGLRRRK